jgi:hypothetical protein
VAHTCNPSYSEQIFRRIERKKFQTLSRKNPSQKRAGGVAQGVGSEFKPQHHKINK